MEYRSTVVESVVPTPLVRT